MWQAGVEAMVFGINGFGNNVNNLLFAINRNTLAMNTAIQRLSTGLRINSGKDDPSGLIAVQQLESEIKAIDAAAENSRRADSSPRR